MDKQSPKQRIVDEWIWEGVHDIQRECTCHVTRARAILCETSSVTDVGLFPVSCYRLCLTLRTAIICFQWWQAG